MKERDKRNIIGCIMWFAVAIVINLLALIPMFVREYYQSRRGVFPLEWDDIMRYGIAITAGSCINGVLLQYLLECVF